MAYPAIDFHDIVLDWEEIFENFHKESADGLLRCTGVTQKLRAIIDSKYPDFPFKEVIRKFCRSRTCIRMKGTIHILRKHL